MLERVAAPNAPLHFKAARYVGLRAARGGAILLGTQSCLPRGQTLGPQPLGQN